MYNSNNKVYKYIDRNGADLYIDDYNNNNDQDNNVQTPPMVDDMFCIVAPTTEFTDIGMLMEDSDQQNLLEEEILEFNETPNINGLISANDHYNHQFTKDIISLNYENKQQQQHQQHKHIHLNDICLCGDIDSFIELMTTENPYILSGFREYTTRSFKQCTKSIFLLHNDTGNIWTHLVPSIFYLYLLISEIIIQIKQHHIMFTISTYTLNLLFYIFSCFLCFFASSVYHTYRSYSLSIYKKTLMFDVSSIGLVILTSVNLIIYTELYCFPRVRTLTLCSFFFLIAAALSLLPKIMREKRFSLRTLIFSFLALQGLMSHLLRLYLESSNNSEFSYSFSKDTNFQWLLMAYFLMGIGLSIRRIKLPEVLSPGKFDIFFSSHQIFHVLVVFGTFFIYNAYGHGTESCSSL